MSYAGKYALAKHETLALKCEDLERQLEEANQAFEHIRQITLNNHDHDTIRINKICNEQLKEQG
jgi:hypothetical protein